MKKSLLPAPSSNGHGQATHGYCSLAAREGCGPDKGYPGMWRSFKVNGIASRKAHRDKKSKRPRADQAGRQFRAQVSETDVNQTSCTRPVGLSARRTDRLAAPLNSGRKKKQT